MAAMLCRRACSRNRTRGVLSSPAPAGGRSRASSPAVTGDRCAGPPKPFSVASMGQRRIPATCSSSYLAPSERGPACELSRRLLRLATGSAPARRHCPRPGLRYRPPAAQAPRTTVAARPGSLAIAGTLRLLIGKTQAPAVSPVDSAQHHLGHRQLGVQRGPGDGTKIQGHPVGERLVPGSGHHRHLRPLEALADPGKPASLLRVVVVELIHHDRGLVHQQYSGASFPAQSAAFPFRLRSSGTG